MTQIMKKEMDDKESQITSTVEEKRQEKEARQISMFSMRILGKYKKQSAGTC